MKQIFFTANYNYTYIYLFTFLPRDCKQITTEFKFCLSQRSTVWKVSWAGTPMARAASKNALIFSMHLNAKVVLLIFLTEPSLMSLISLKQEIPFCSIL